MSKYQDVDGVISIDGCTTQREAMFRAIDVAIQWLDEGENAKAREALCAAYCPIYDEEEKKHDKGKPSLLCID